MTWHCEQHTKFSRPSRNALDRQIIIHHRNSPSGYYNMGFKRVLDLLVVILSAPFAVPVVLFLALIIACDGGSPFYNQRRVGKSGRIYKMWKLRTMVKEADQNLTAYLQANPAAKAEWDKAQKLTHDPRITRFGLLLRKTSLDELPQLWNVFKGDMSLVGPRPMMPEQQHLYSGSAYYSLRPGITGLWQVSARNNSTFADRANFDDKYSRDLSFFNDLGLLLATASVVLKATGH